MISAGVFFTFCTVLYFETYRLSDCYYFLPSDYRNIVYRTGEFEKISDYLMSDQVLNISEYRLSDSQKTVGSPALYITWVNTCVQGEPNLETCEN